MFASDVYLPAMPKMADYFLVSSDVVQLTLASYLLGSAALGLVYGPLADFYGRRPIFLGGMTVFLISAIGCALVVDVYTLIAFRFLQGCGGAAALVVSWVMIKDVFPGPQSTKIIARTAMAIVVSPAIAPVVGGHMTAAFGWRSVFILLVVMAVLMWLLLMAYLPETISKDTIAIKRKFSIRKVLKNYCKLLSNAEFLSYAMINGLLNGGKWCFITVAPFVFIDILHIPEEIFGYYIAGIIMGYIVGSIVTQILTTRLADRQLMRTGLSVSFASALVLMIFAKFYPDCPGYITIATACYFAGFAMLSPAASTAALETSTQMKGTRSSLITFVRILFSSLGALVGGLLEDVDFLATGLYLTASTIIAVLLLWRLPANHKS